MASQQFECLFNALFGPTSKNIKSPHFWLFVKGIHRSPVDSLHKGPVMREAFLWDMHQCDRWTIVWRNQCASYLDFHQFWQNMMTSWNENAFHITAPLWVELTFHRWIPFTKGQWITALIVFFSLNKLGQTLEFPMICGALTLMWRQRNEIWTNRISNREYFFILDYHNIEQVHCVFSLHCVWIYFWYLTLQCCMY